MSHFGRSGPPDIADTYSLLVLNITFRTTADDLFPLFDKYGKVVDVFIPRDRRTGESRGFAFVRYKYADEAQKAVDRLDGRVVDGREITVQFAKYGPHAERIHKGRIIEKVPRSRNRSRSRSPRRRSRDDYRDRDRRRRSRSRSVGRYSRDRDRGRDRDYYTRQSHNPKFIRLLSPNLFMENNNKLLDKLFCACFLALSTIYPVAVNCERIMSCTQLPYPETCNYFMGHNVLPSLEENTMSAFHDLALRVTMDQAVQVHRLVSSVGLSSFDGQASLARSDCLELYENTIDQLNRSMSSSTISPRDSQTWLSAMITNHETCQNGFKELNLESYLQYFPDFVMTNFSKLLSNSLAINNAYTVASAPNPIHSQVGRRAKRRLLADGFPEWVSASDRKLLQAQAVSNKAGLVVAKDGTGNFKTISEAVAASAKLRRGNRRFVIHVKAGTYTENVEIKRSMKNLMIIGDGIDATVVTGSRNVQDGSTTFRSATFAVTGDRFIARDMTFVNTAGPQKHQAVALRSGSDFSVFYRCSFKGYQDTLYVHSQRQFYRDCDIYGTVDFIFGDAVVVIQNCNIYARKPMSGQKNTVTAQARTDPNQNTGIVIHRSLITATSDLKSMRGSVKTFLGRPWKKYSRTVIVKSSLDGRVIDPQGWLPWSGSFALSTLYYGEYMNTGTGARTSRRVKWPGYHIITSASEARKFTVENFLAGDFWIPSTGVPFSTGL